MLVSTYLNTVDNPSAPPDPHNLPLLAPDENKRVYVYHSASITFYAPSDPSGIGGMRREHIRATPSWWGGPARYDCVFASGDEELPGLRGLLTGRLCLLFSFTYRRVQHSCALVEWFTPHGNEPDEDTDLWIVTPDYDATGTRVRGVISLDSLVRGAHLIPVYGLNFLPRNLAARDVLSAFQAYFVNKFADHHSHTLAF